MNKEKIIEYINSLEQQANQSDKYFKERNDLYIENTSLKQALNEIREYINSMKHLEGWIDIDGYAKREKDILQMIDKVGGNDGRN